MAGVIDILKNKPGQVTTLWYVIEHMPDLRTDCLETLNKTLLKGGVLAFGTPSGQGNLRQEEQGALSGSQSGRSLCYLYSPGSP